MKPLRRQSLVEQSADHLRDGFRTGRWSGKLPGVLSLSKALGVSRDTIREAVWLLEEEGALKASGAGKSRVIVPGRKKDAHRRILRVGLLLYSPLSQDNAHSQELILSIKHGVEQSGHVFVICPKTVEDLGNNTARLSRVINEMQADAWMVYSGTREIYEWFSKSSLPVFALGGRSLGLSMAGSRTDLSSAMSEAVDALVERGHRRIVLICQSIWRQPSLGLAAQAFVNRLSQHSLKPDVAYNVPDWPESAEGLQKLLKALFFATPPTALLLHEPMLAPPTLAFLAGRGLKVPADVSVINLMPDPALAWYRPELAHFDWPLLPHAHRAVRWVEAVALGKADKEAITVSAKFVPAGTIGKATK